MSPEQFFDSGFPMHRFARVRVPDPVLKRPPEETHPPAATAASVEESVPAPVDPVDDLVPPVDDDWAQAVPDGSR
jgi:hypothetical protein